MRRPSKETIVQDDHLDFLAAEAAKDLYALDEPETAARVRSLIGELPWDLQEVYYLRYGESRSIRQIARLLGFNSHWPIQERLRKIREFVEENL